MEFSRIDRFSKGSIVGPIDYKVFRRPVELGRVTGQWDLGRFRFSGRRFTRKQPHNATVSQSTPAALNCNLCKLEIL
jgi:hypothetical protein